MPQQVGTFILPQPAGDPTTPTDGQVWYDATNRKTRVMEAGKASDIIDPRRVMQLEVNFRKLLQAFVMSGQPIPPGLENDFMQSLGE
jgi:hypothetical protein